MIATLLALQLHPFHLQAYGEHLFFDAIADAGGWYAARFCQHLWHRIAVAAAFALVTTLALITLIG